MHTVRFKRLGRLQVLKRIGRELSAQFFGRFEEEFNAHGLALPPPRLSDSEYAAAWAALLAHPERLPEGVIEVLAALDELAEPRAFELLEASPEWGKFHFQPQSTREEILLQLWFLDRKLLTRLHNCQRFKRLTSFEVAASAVPRSQRVPFDETDKFAVCKLSTSLDEWFLRNQRGEETARVEVFPIDGEFWFLIRHGDMFTRASAVKRQETEYLLFRPERDDVVVIAPSVDELRVNARTKGERDLYFEQFGLHLRGRADYYSVRTTYTLEPLRTQGVLALDPGPVQGIRKIRLRELEVASHHGDHRVITEAVQGLFEFAAAVPERPYPIPDYGVLQRAIFEVQFTGSIKSYPFEVRTPNMLKISRGCDARLVHEWLARSAFRLEKVEG